MIATEANPYSGTKSMLLHGLKHHRDDAVEQIKRIDQAEALSEFMLDLQHMGTGVVDWYIATLSQDQVLQEIHDQIKPHIQNKSSYRQWLQDGGTDFRVLEISDGSKWVLRMGKRAQRFVHIHPARNSPGTIRVKANQLKMAVATVACARFWGQSETEYGTQQVARKLVGLPPLAPSDTEPGAARLIRLLAAAL